MTDAATPATPGLTPPPASGSPPPADTTRDAAPFVDKVLQRATQGAHDAVDSAAAKVSSVADRVQGGVSKVGDTGDEWIEAARDAIRGHPFAAVGGALLVGAALLSLLTSRDR